MSQPRLFICNGVNVPTDDPLRKGRYVKLLATQGSKSNITLKVEDVAKVSLEHLSERLEDLLEIATFVYVGDSATERSGTWKFGEAIEPWERDMTYVIPVRDLSFWSQPEVQDLLSDTLNFLSDDTYRFEFRQKANKGRRQKYLEVGPNDDWPFYDADRVIMFSGGLDSLAGAVRTASKGEKVILVSHRPVTTQGKRQRELFDQLRLSFPGVRMVHVPVEVNKEAKLKGDYFQRTRSFLFSALGTVVASSVRAKGVRFFENGVVSLNLPVAGETVGARASRTTHPLALSRFSELYELVLERPVIVDNPFIHLTKSEVLDEIAKYGRESLIRFTCSCAHQGYGQTKLSLHCGTCSQCIDRRFAVLAAGLEEHDPAIDYRTDVFTGTRDEGYERNMAINYVRHASALNQMTVDQITAEFNMELSRAVRHASDRHCEAAALIDMHKRHAQKVCEVLGKQIGSAASSIIDGKLPATSLLRLVGSGEHCRPSWEKLADRISGVLQAGLPIACKKNKPKTEPDLQNICDGLLRAASADLDREYPYMPWGWGTTKPDWSSEPHKLWIELKYVRKSAGAAQIGEAIAADITRYGDNGQRVLFVVYDPEHLIPSDSVFLQRIDREGVTGRILR